MRLLVPAIGALALTASALAAELPNLVPTRDHVVTYTIRSGDDTVTLTNTVSAGGRLQRVDQGPMSMVLNGADGSGLMIHHEARMAMRLPPGQFPDPMHEPRRGFTEPGASVRRTGRDRVAGHECAVWEMRSPRRGDGVACITEDGVMLRGTFRDEQGRTSTMEASELRYGPVPASAFAPPPGYQVMDLPTGAVPAPRR